MALQKDNENSMNDARKKRTSLKEGGKKSTLIHSQKGTFEIILIH